MTRNNRKRALPLLVMAFAAIGSIATSTSPYPTWILNASTPGPDLTLDGSGDPVIHEVGLHLNAQATSGEEISGGELVADALACLTATTSGAPARMRLLVQQQSTGDGSVQEQAVPDCPETVNFNASASGFDDCVLNEPCDSNFFVTFQRTGGLQGEIDVTWNANGMAFSFGVDTPPEGAELTVTVAP